MSARTYTTRGSVRGSCGHKHRSLATAVACARSDMRACKGLPGGTSYSDRWVVRADGSEMTDHEMREIDFLEGRE